jgi:hypothetical protein
MSYCTVLGATGLQRGAEFIKDVLSDPALPETTLLVKELYEVEKAKPKTKSIITGPGIGLANTLTPLRTLIFYRKNEWALPLTIAALIGVPFLLGMTVGRRRR